MDGDSLTKLQIKFSMDNAAFGEYGSYEVARILKELAERIEGHPHISPGHSQPIKDINGNSIGYLDILE